MEESDKAKKMDQTLRFSLLLLDSTLQWHCQGRIMGIIGIRGGACVCFESRGEKAMSLVRRYAGPGHVYIDLVKTWKTKSYQECLAACGCKADTLLIDSLTHLGEVIGNKALN